MIRVLKYLVFITLSSLALSVEGQIYSKPNNSYGIIYNRTRPDSTSLIPTFPIAPSGTASLHSINQKMGATYCDSTGHRFYFFDPSDSSWTKLGATQLNDSTIIVGRDTVRIHAGSGGGGVTLINASGAGDSLFVTPNKVKRIDHDATLVISTSANKLLMGADTISYVTTPSKLRDTAAALRAAIAGGGSATLSNVGSGYRLVKTAGGQIKTLFAGDGTVIDSSTNTNGLTIKRDTTGSNGTVTRSELKDTARSLKRTISDSLVYALKSILLPSRLEFIATADTATYQDSALIGTQIMMLSIESYQVGFTTRSTSIYMAFDATTGTISLTNGQFTAGDQVIIIYRTPPVFLLDGSGNPIRDSSGNFIIIN